MVRTLASILLLGMIPHAGLGEFAYSLPNIEVVPVASPRVLLSAVELPHLSASGVLLMDMESGQVLFEKAADERRPIGSLTKMMTALLLVEDHQLSEMFEVPEIATHIGGSAIGLTEGQKFTLEDLLLALLLPSANDVAYMLAIDDGGSVAKFVTEMNVRAQALGLKDTHFTNPAGFDAVEQYSTPRNLAWLSAALLRKPELKAMVRRRYATIYSDTGIRFDLSNTNELLHSRPNVLGLKTGTTDDAGQCLITLFMEGNRTYLLVLLNSAARFNDAKLVMDAVSAAPKTL